MYKKIHLAVFGIRNIMNYAMHIPVNFISLLFHPKCSIFLFSASIDYTSSVMAVFASLYFCRGKAKCCKFDVMYDRFVIESK